MIPRFIIRNVDADIITILKNMGYVCLENPVPAHVMVAGNGIVPAPPISKNPLIVIFNNGQTNGNGVIIHQAKLHLDWSREKYQGRYLKIELEKAELWVTKFGVLIDFFVIPITKLMELHQILKKGLIAPYPSIATHDPVPAKVEGKLTIGCADYSLTDFDKIMAAYNSLLT